MRKILYIGVILVLALSACERDDSDGSGVASLSISFEVPEYSGDVSVKGIEDGIDPTGWTDAEKLKDGRIMDKLFVGLIDSDGDLVAYRLIHKGASGLGADNGFIPDGETSVNTAADYGREALLTFDYLSPLREVEKLKAEQYTVFALANYSGYTEVEDLIDGIVGSFDNSNGIPGFKASDKWSSLTGFSHTPADGVYGGERMPLSLIQNLTLAPGDNNVSLKLIRQFARIRFQIRNYSDQPLTVGSFSFDEKFAQLSSKLMYDPLDPAYEENYVQVNATAANSIVKFSPKDNESGNALQKGETAVIFDGYINESRHSDPYVYNLHLKYADVVTTLGEVKKDILISSLGSLYNEYCNGYRHFIMMSAKYQGRFVKENVPGGVSYISNGGTGNPATDYLHLEKNEISVDNLIVSRMGDFAETIDGMTAKITAGDYSYLWEFKYRNEGVYQISNLASKRYLFKSDRPAYTLEDPVDLVVREKTSDPEGLLFSDPTELSSYLNFMGSAGYDCLGESTWDDGGSRFVLIPVDIVPTPEMRSKIVLDIIDPVTAVVTQADEIKRNDFINVLIEVYYNEVSNQFDFKVVKDWTPYVGDVEYN